MNADATAADFHHCAQEVYRDDPLWLGEDLQALTQQLEAAFTQEDLQIWTKCLPGVARLAVTMSPRQMIDGKLCAFFGFWETLNSPDQNAALFKEAEHWARDQGAARLIGPINLSTFYSYRIRLNEFAAGAFPGEPYNPPYYEDLLTQQGFGLLKTFHSWLGPVQGRPEKLAATMEPMVQALETDGVTFRPLTGDIWMNRLDEFYRYVDQIFGNNFAYTPLSQERFQAGFGAPLANRLCPHSSVLAEHRDGSIAGFFLSFPDYAPLIRQGNPNRQALADCTFEDVANMSHPPMLLGKTGGVHPDYRHRGLFAVMSYLMLKQSTRHYDWGGAVLVREDNPSARVGATVFGMPGDQRRDYGLFAKDL